MRAALGVFPDQTTTQIGLDLDHLVTIKANTLWLVVDIAWAFPTNTTMDSTVATKLDACVNGAISRGLNVALQVHGSPSWIVTAGGHTYPGNIWHGPDNASERGNWVTCLHNAINRWGATKITWVEIWNEPNLTAFWNGPAGISAADYMRLLQACYVDIKATWPAIQVVGHNISRNDIGWIQDAYAWSDSIFGAATSAANSYYHNVVGVHPYCGDATSGYAPTDTSHADLGGSGGGVLDPDYLGYRRIQAETVTKEGGGGKPLAFGEFGYAIQAGWFNVTAANRATYIGSAFSLAAADGYVAYLTVYYHKPSEAVVDHDTSFNIHPSAGATTSETAFTTAAAALGATLAAGFNATYWPRLRVRANFGAGLIDIGTDSTGKRCIRSFARSLGRNSPIDSADPAACTIVFTNRSGDYDAAFGSALYKLTVGTPIDVDVEWPTATFKDRFTGTVQEVLLDVDVGPDPTVTINCTDGLEQLGRTQFPEGLTTFASLTTGGRIDALATLAGWTAARAIDTAAIRIFPVMEMGSTALDLMQKLEMTEAGLLFVAENGTLTFWDRYHHQTATRSTATQLTITDSLAASTVKAVALSRSRSRDQVYNDIHLIREADPGQDPELTVENRDARDVGSEPGDEPQEMTASDATSITANGHLNLPADVGKLHSSDPAVLDHANMLVNQYKTVQDRIGSVSINVLQNKIKTENLYATVLGLTLLDRIVVVRDYGPATISATMHIQRIEEEFTQEPPTWNLTLTTSNVPPTINRFILGTSSIGTNSIGW